MHAAAVCGLVSALLATLAPTAPQDPEDARLALPEGGRRAEAFQRSAAALDPTPGGWTSEARADAVSAQLGRLAAYLEHPSEPGALAALFAPDFVAQVPEAQAPVFQDAALRIERSGEGRAAEDGPAFLARLERWSRAVPSGHAKFKTVRVEAGEDELVTDAVLLFDGTQGTRAAQINSWWRCRWREEAGGEPPRLAGLRVLGHEEVQARGPQLLSDRTTELLSGVDAWERQLVPGLDEWRARLDTRLGVPLLGHAAGIAVADVNGDGLEDLYLCQPGGLPNKLLVHTPAGGVRDVSSEAGVDFLDFSRSALLLDLDGDGDRDLAVNAGERLLLLANDGQARFWLQAAFEAPDATSMAAADVDLDGDLDLYLCAYASPYDHSALPVPYHDAQNGRPNRLLENRGDWLFVDATAERGLDANNTRFSFAASFEDYDLDGDPDLYVANDFGRNNLYRNEGGRFEDVAAQAGVEDLSAGMGVAWGDYDGDGWFDLYVSNMYSSAGNRIAYQRRFQEGASDEVRRQYQRHAHGNTLFRNEGDGRFEDVSLAEDPLGIAMGRWAWGALFADLNVDGWPDLLSPNGFLTEARTHDL